MTDKSTIESAISRVRGEVAYLLPVRTNEEAARVELIREARLALIEVLKSDEIDHSSTDEIRAALAEAALDFSDTKEEADLIVEAAMEEIEKAALAQRNDDFEP